MANEDLKDALKTRGIDFAGNASRAVLQGLLDKAIKDEDLAAKAAGADPEKKGPELGKSTGSGDGSPPGAVPAVTTDTVAAAAKQEAAAKEAAAKEAADKEAADKSRFVNVRVISQTLGEDHERYEKGDTFLTSLERAVALAAFVEIV